MRTYYFIVSIIIIRITCSYGQNLVLNPSFEEYIFCPEAEGDFEGFVKNWHSFFGSSEYYVCDFRPNWVQNYPYKGDAMCGLRIFDPFSINDPRREYFHGSLNSILTKGNKYYIEYFLLIDHLVNTHDQYSVYFSPEVVNQVIEIGDNPPYLLLPAQINNQKGIIDIVQKWVAMTGCFIAEGGEQYFTIGNFVPNAQTNFTNNESNTGSYEFIDYVRLFEVEDLIYSDTSLCPGAVFIPNRYELKGLKTMINGVEIDSFMADEEGNFEVEYILDDCGIIGTSMIEVKRCADCSQQINPSYTICADSILSLDGLLPVGVFFRDQMDEILTEFSNRQAGTYQLFISSDDCSITGTANIEVSDCTTCDLYVPNVFTPNDDGTNDYFRAFHSCDLESFEMTLVNRWGDIIFKSSDINIGWDGNYKSTQADIGIYIYMIKYKQNGHPALIIKGDVTLLSSR